MEIFIMEVIAKYPIVGIVLMVLGALLIVAQAIVIATPSKADDEKLEKMKQIPVVGKIFAILLSFAPVQKNGEKLELSGKK